MPDIQPDTQVPPVAKKVPQERTHHGDTVVDNYEWLRAKEDPEVLAHLESENAFTEATLAHLGYLRSTIFEEIRSRVQETDLSVPVRRGSWWYFTRSTEGKQYGTHCRAPITAADDWNPPTVAEGQLLAGEQVILDDNAEASGHDFYSLGTFDLSADGRYLLFGVDTVGDERYTLRVRDLDSGESLADSVPGTFPGAIFSPDGRYFFYPTVDDAWRPDTIWRHELGTDAGADVVVFAEPDERYWVGISLGRSRRYLQIDLGSKITSETLLAPADDPTAAFRVVWPRREGVEYSVEHAVSGGENLLYILHNEGALNFELVAVPVDDPDSDTRRIVLPHREDTRLEGVDSFSAHTIVSYRRDGIARVGVLLESLLDEERSFEHDARGGTDAELHGTGIREIDFDEPLFTVGVGANPDWSQPTVRLGYGSMITPATVYDYVIEKDFLRLLKQQPVLGGYDPTDYQQKRLWARAADGTSIPISLVGRAGFLDTAQPRLAPAMVLYGYGSYEHSIDPSFSAARLSLLDRGVVFAIAHVRGGGELGRGWYEQGKTLTKKNTFSDFVAVADHLIEEAYTSPERLVAEGRSAGGLLMGAVANLGPERFAGILAGVPFVDPLTSILDPLLPLTVIEWDEWGNPLASAEVYEYMKSYSPYENVRAVAYPRILATTSLNDTRVLYVEPAKWVARLREVGAPALLRTEMSAGHGGVSGRYDAWQERAYELAWILDVLGHTD